jgi:hypothetical protein
MDVVSRVWDANLPPKIIAENDECRLNIMGSSSALCGYPSKKLAQKRKKA